MKKLVSFAFQWNMSPVNKICISCSSKLEESNKRRVY